MKLCLYCGKRVDYDERSNPDTFFVRGTKVDYLRVSAHCPICKREIYVPELHDQNCINREKAYQQAVKEKNG